MNEEYVKKYANAIKKRTKHDKKITEPDFEGNPDTETFSQSASPNLITLLNIKIVPCIPLKEIIHDQKRQLPENY